MNQANLVPSIEVCIENGERLIEDAQLLKDFDRLPTALSLSILAQEEFAKAFLLILVQKQVIPWTAECRRALRNHECKHLTGVMIEWLGPPLNEALERCQNSGRGNDFEFFPQDVASAINILRHEKFERFRFNYAERDPESNGLPRKIAEGKLDRKKQQGFYVGVNSYGKVNSLPTSITENEFKEQFERANLYRIFATDASLDCVLSFVEYRFFCDAVTAVFADLAINRTA